MRKKNKSIPVNPMANGVDTGIVFERMSFADLSAEERIALRDADDPKQTHRHDTHAFFLLESGTVFIEIDFKKYKIRPSTIVYMHPDQVHRTMVSDTMVVCSWAITNENLNPEYLKLLEAIKPAAPLVLKKETFAVMSEAVSLCMKLSQRKADKLYHSLLKDSCNALVALVISQYVQQSKPIDTLSRFEIVTKAFREALDRHYLTVKRPAEYAQKLNISTPYLNECVKEATGYPVSYHIQQRVILEAKRLLYYSDRSVKEIASDLGYDDYPYFSRLFTKVTGMTALAFRNKNLD